MRPGALTAYAGTGLCNHILSLALLRSLLPNRRGSVSICLCPPPPRFLHFSYGCHVPGSEQSQTPSCCGPSQSHVFPGTWPSPGSPSSPCIQDRPTGRLQAGHALGHVGYVCAQSLSRVQLFCDPMDCSPPGSSVLGIFQARILEWIAIYDSRGSSPPRDRTHVSCIFFIGRWILYH